MTLFAAISASFVILLLVIFAMGIGVMAGRKPIKGSCGGIGAGSCELCSGDCEERNGR